MSIKDTKSCTAGTTNAPFSGATLTQHSIRGVLTADKATRRYNIHWLNYHFGLDGDGRDSAKHPHPTEPNETIAINNGGIIFHDPTTGTTGGVWKFFGDYILKESNEAKALQKYMELCQGMYSDLRFPVPKPPVDTKTLNIPWDREMWTPTDEDLEQLRGICQGFASIESQEKARSYNYLNMVNYPAPDGRMHKCFAIGWNDARMELIPYDGGKLWDTDPNSFDNRTLALELRGSGYLGIEGTLDATSPIMLTVGARDYMAAMSARLREDSTANIFITLSTNADLASSFLEECKGHKVVIYTGVCCQYRDAGERWLEQLRDFGIDAEIFQQQGDQTLVEYATSGAAICPDTIAKEVA